MISFVSTVESFAWSLSLSLGTTNQASSRYFAQLPAQFCICVVFVFTFKITNEVSEQSYFKSLSAIAIRCGKKRVLLYRFLYIDKDINSYGLCCQITTFWDKHCACDCIDFEKQSCFIIKSAKSFTCFKSIIQLFL